MTAGPRGVLSNSSGASGTRPTGMTDCHRPLRHGTCFTREQAPAASGASTTRPASTPPVASEAARFDISPGVDVLQLLKVLPDDVSQLDAAQALRAIAEGKIQELPIDKGKDNEINSNLMHKPLLAEHPRGVQLPHRGRRRRAEARCGRRAEAR